MQSGKNFSPQMKALVQPQTTSFLLLVDIMNILHFPCIQAIFQQFQFIVFAALKNSWDGELLTCSLRNGKLCVLEFGYADSTCCLCNVRHHIPNEFVRGGRLHMPIPSLQYYSQNIKSPCGVYSSIIQPLSKLGEKYKINKNGI